MRKSDVIQTLMAAANAEAEMREAESGIPPGELAEALEWAKLMAWSRAMMWGVPFDYLYDAGVDGVITALKRWQPDHESGKKFCSFAYQAVCQAMTWRRNREYRREHLAPMVAIGETELPTNRHRPRVEIVPNLAKIQAAILPEDWLLLKSIAELGIHGTARERGVSAQAIHQRKDRIVKGIRARKRDFLKAEVV